MIAALIVAAAPFVMYGELTGSVDPGSAGWLVESIKAAQDSGAEALIVRLDTPGGLLSATRDAVQVELSAHVPVVFWVGPPGARAGSAGVFLTLAAHVAAMAPSTNIGAAHPVGLFGLPDDKDAPDKHEDTMAKKMENDTAAFVRGIAERRSRNVEWAEKAVRDSESITASKALELKVIDLVAEDLPDLMQKLDGRKVELGGGDSRILHTASAEVRPATWAVRDRVLHGLANPEVTFLIGILGVIGVMLEMFHPGTIVPGVVGGICIIIAAIGLQMLPVNVGALILVLLGVGFFVAEMYIGGHGGFIAAGLVCVVIGSLLLVGHVGSNFYADPDFGLGWRVVAPVGAAMALIAGTLVWKLSSSARQPLRAGGYSLIGEVGEVREGDTVLVAGELWKARSADPLVPGSRARVLAVRGLTLEVAPEGAALTKAGA
ncbi:MAG TPA: nodulation protein NfeD [Myxococcales bacterium]|nr:nodulation protein NfeD [Myxococcales bacterium]